MKSNNFPSEKFSHLETLTAHLFLNIRDVQGSKSASIRFKKMQEIADTIANMSQYARTIKKDLDVYDRKELRKKSRHLQLLKMPEGTA